MRRFYKPSLWIPQLFPFTNPNLHYGLLAILPLENVSGTSEQDYFADGMTDELITQLARLNDVRVISRSSVLQFKGSRRPLSEIAGVLHVDAVVEGSVLRQGNTVRITAQLVEVATDRHLWAQSYQGEVSDVIRLQDEIAHAVADEIQAKLRPTQSRLDTPRRTVTPEAYDAYLQGLYFSARLTPDNLTKAFDYFNQAIGKEPTFAPAYAQLAEAYTWASTLFLPAQEVLPKAEDAAGKALKIDPSLSVAHQAFAWVKYARYWDFPSAELEFNRAIELDPNNATAHLWYGMYLAQRKRTDESLAEMQRARQLDPVSSIVHSLAMTPLLTSHQYDKVIEESNLALKSDPNDGVLQWLLLSAYEQKGDLAQAIDLQERQAIASGDPPERARAEWATLRKEVSAQGKRAYWLNRLKASSFDSAADPFNLAVAEAHLGESDAMFASLEKCYKQRSTALLFCLLTESAFDPFRADSRFRDLERRVGVRQ